MTDSLGFTLGFTVMPLYSSKFQVNARDVEDALQKKFQFLPLGCRLWRCVDNGLKYELPDGTDKVHTVSIDSDEIIPMINKGLIEVCETKRGTSEQTKLLTYNNYIRHVQI